MRSQKPPDVGAAMKEKFEELHKLAKEKTNELNRHADVGLGQQIICL